MPVRYRGYRHSLLRRWRLGRPLSRAPACTVLADAVCVPVDVGTEGGLDLRMRGGVYTSEGRYVAASGVTTAGKPVLGPGDACPQAVERLRGRSLYLGLAHYHYGHFLVETLSRLWPYDRTALRGFDHLVLLPWDGHVAAFVHEILSLCGVADRLHVLRSPTRVDALHVPSPSVSYPAHVHRQVAAIGALCTVAGPVTPTDQPLFLSRSALVPGHHRQVVGEEWIERKLAEQGARIFHPERHTVAEQIAALRSHRRVVGFAGSAMHTLLMSGGGRQVVAYSARAVPAVFPLIDLALGNDATHVHAPREVTDRAAAGIGFRPERIDPRPVLAQLQRAGWLRDARLDDYGSPAAEAAELCRFRTAVLLRRILELSQTPDEPRCQDEIASHVARHPLDEALIRQACEGSALLRRYFGETGGAGPQPA